MSQASANSDPSTASNQPHSGPVVWLRNKLLAGLALALPLVITLVIVQFVYNLLHGWSEPIVTWVADLINEMAGSVLVRTTDPNFVLATRFIGVLIPLLALVALGVMATNVIGVHIVGAFDRLMLRIPFVSFIYKSLKQVIDSFKKIGGAQNFKRVAYIDYPVPGMKMLGFVTGQFTDPASGKAKTTVFVPTAPNPMSGILLVVDSEKVVDAEISIEDSMKMIFSAGLVAPDRDTPPLNGRATDVEALPVAVAAGGEGPDQDGDAKPTQEPLAAAEETVMLNLPRAEDFDSGDPDILADVDTVERDEDGVSVARKLGKVFAPWSWRS